MPLLPSFFVSSTFGLFFLLKSGIFSQQGKKDSMTLSSTSYSHSIPLLEANQSNSRWPKYNHSPWIVLGSRLHWRVCWKAVKINAPHTLKLAPSAPFSNRTRSNRTISGRQFLKTHCTILQMDGGLPHQLQNISENALPFCCSHKIPYLSSSGFLPGLFFLSLRASGLVCTDPFPAPLILVLPSLSKPVLHPAPVDSSFRVLLLIRHGT